MERIASMFFHSRTQAHVFHLRVKGPGAFAVHSALNTYYDEIVGIIDGLVESYQGKYGIIEFKEVNNLDNDASVENIIKYFTNLCTFLEKERQDAKLKDSWIQNQIDNISELLYSTKYKLVNLQ
jgi:DNA-binding ferritin-like protein